MCDLHDGGLAATADGDDERGAADDAGSVNGGGGTTGGSAPDVKVALMVPPADEEDKGPVAPAVTLGRSLSIDDYFNEGAKRPAAQDKAPTRGDLGDEGAVITPPKEDYF
mmetsp:Transcript_41340/g.110347  ORF Transcript_41340/g.110347 Transcript_41340/m.110347 type:complete len:110 (+) Transcript_41340:498-827(+)